MNINLGKLKSILETAKKLQNGEIKTPTTLKGLIDHYNLVSYNNGNPTDLPTIQPFDEEHDLSWNYTSLARNGPSKLANLIVYTEGYINAHTPIPPIINKVEGWKKSIVITVVIGIIGVLIAISVFYADHTYQEGLSNGKAEMQKEYDSEKIQLSKNIQTLEAKFKLTNDSLIECKKDNFEKDVSINLLEVNCNTNTKKPAKGK